MSSFKDNFTREENQGNLDYDDSAFYTFAATILIMIILPLIYKVLMRLLTFTRLYKDKKYSNCKCKACLDRLDAINAKEKRKQYNFGFFFMILLLVGLIYLFTLSYQEVGKNSGKMKTFNPFEILEIEPEATDKQVKQAFRKMSKKYHPDKNRAPEAKAKFILITKAYEALTNEVAKENFRKYGNPDGPGPMRLSVALPSFVLNKKNHMPILVLFLILVVVIIPAFVWFWYSNSQRYDESGMMVENHKIYYELMNENLLLRQVPYVLGASEEYSFGGLKSSDIEELNKLFKANSTLMPKSKIKEHLSESNQKAICLLYAHCTNSVIISENLKSDLDELLNKAPNVLANMYNFAFQYTQLHAFAMDKDLKYFGLDCMRTLLRASQCVHQKLPINSQPSPFSQVPHLAEARLRKLYKHHKKHFNCFNTFIRMEQETRKKILGEEFNEEELVEIEKAIESLPKYNVKVDVYVEGFDEIVINDVITIKVTVERENLKDEQELGIAHSLVMPENFEEKIYLIIYLQKKVVYETNLHVTDRISSHEFTHMAREFGSIKLNLDMISFNYQGLDQTIEFDMNIATHSAKRKEFLEQIEKKEPKKLEPSFFQQMLGSVLPYNMNEEEEEEEEDENEDEDKKGEKKEGKPEEENAESNDQKAEFNDFFTNPMENGNKKYRKKKKK